MMRIEVVFRRDRSVVLIAERFNSLIASESGVRNESHNELRSGRVRSLNRRRISVVASLVIAAAMVNSGCGGGGGTGITTASSDGTGPEPAGGRFLPVVLSSADTIPVAAPPATNSAQTAQEIQELTTIQSQRQSPIVRSKKQLTSAQSRDTVNFWNTGACVRWNEIARSLVIKYSTNPPLASRVYALVSVAQYDALVVAYRNKYLYNRLEIGRAHV